jgi:hypothetical protein
MRPPPLPYRRGRPDLLISTEDKAAHKGRSLAGDVERREADPRGRHRCLTPGRLSALSCVEGRQGGGARQVDDDHAFGAVLQAKVQLGPAEHGLWAGSSITRTVNQGSALRPACPCPTPSQPQQDRRRAINQPQMRNRPASLLVSLYMEPPPESNRRPHPYHGTTRNRCANRHIRRSRPTVGAEVIGSLSGKLCALVQRASWVLRSPFVVL